LQPNPNRLVQARADNAATATAKGGILPFMFFDLHYAHEQESALSLSKVNLGEVRFCIKVLKLLNDILHHSKAHQSTSIGVITPYNEQLNELQRAYTKIPSTSLNVEFNTVDGFQGREKDIILISTVRANEAHTIGFLSDLRRMNVAITRAKYVLIVIGHVGTLKSDVKWAALAEYAYRMQCLIPVHREEMTVHEAMQYMPWYSQAFYSHFAYAQRQLPQQHQHQPVTQQVSVGGKRKREKEIEEGEIICI
jgi:hypothetical protein